MITGKLVAVNSEQSLSALTRLIGKGGEPLVRKGVNMAMRMMGEQFVSGQTISEALANNRKMEARGFRYSYDMLGEAATTAEDADRYYASYEQAIHAIGKAAAGRGIYEGPGISIKLSALHPRYSRAQRERVMAELLPRVKALTALARSYDIGLNIDAEEADRLEISLDLLEALCFAPELDGWNGIGFVIQAYQKRAPFVIDYVIDGAPQPPPRDGAAGQGRLLGQRDQARPGRWPEGYPVYTRKIYTDVAWLAPASCWARRGRVSAVRHAQRLHAVGHLSAGRPELLPRSVRVPVPARHGRAAVRRSGRPVGAGQAEPPVSHLCAGGHARDAAGLSGAPPAGEWRQHLVREPDRRREHSGRAAGVRSGGRRLARRAAGRAAREDPCRANSSATRRKARAPTPPAGPEQRASPGIAVGRAAGQRRHDWRGPMLGEGAQAWDAARAVEVRNPANLRDRSATSSRPMPRKPRPRCIAANAAPIWQSTPVAERAQCLRRAAQLLEEQMQTLLGLIVREAGKSLPNAIAEVREAVDFLRYYADQASREFGNDTHRPLGTVLCISPWNFPLAIFTGGRRRAGGRQYRAGQARRADAADRGPGHRDPARRRRGWRRATAARPWRDRRRAAGGQPWRARRHVHRLDRRGAHHRPRAGRSPGRRRPHHSADRRDRRPERDGGGFVGAGRAGRVRRAQLGLRFGRPALLGCACCASRKTAPTTC